MNFSPALAAIARFDWCHPDVGAHPAAQLLADVFWWERRANVSERIQAIEAAGSAATPAADELHFCLAYAAMSVGDAAQLAAYAGKLSQDALGQCLGQWLSVETAGRTRDYAEQARTVQRLLKTYGTMPDWLATACFASLNHQGVNPAPLLAVMTKHQINAPLASLVVARLLAAAGRPEQAFKVLISGRNRWPECAALSWFEGLLRAQLGDTRLSQSLIDAAVQRGLACMAVLRIWLDILVSKPGAVSTQEVDAAYQRALVFVAKDARQSAEIASYRIIQSWIEGDLRTAHRLLTQHHGFQHMEEQDTDRAAQVFMRYAVLLCVAWQHNQHLYPSDAAVPPFYVFGESHSLTSSNMVIDWYGAPHRANTCFMMGTKMWHLAEAKANRFKAKLHDHLQAIDAPSPLLFTVGEIDCRPDEGIWKIHKKTGRPVAALIKNTVGGYLKYLDNALAGRTNVTIAGVPAPRYSLDGKRDPGNKEGFLSMVRDVNEQLKQGAQRRGWGFLDIYSATVGEDGRSNEKWHLDGWHLQPAFYSKAHEWLVKPVSDSN